MADTDNYLTGGRLISGLFTISLPIIASNLLQSVLEVVDMYFIGRLGADAIAGVAMSTTLIFVLATFVIGLVTATTAILSFAMNGAGDTRKPMYATLISMVLIQIPLAYFLPSSAGMGITGIWAAIITGIVLQAILLIVMYRQGEWKSVAL